MDRCPHRIILARHGETIFNRDGFIMGRSDAPLTEYGLATACRLGNLLHTEAILRVYSSPLGRARTSAAIYAERLNAAIFEAEEMAELSCGVFEGKPRAVVEPSPGRLRPTWDYRLPGGESYRDAEPRVAAFISRICGLLPGQARIGDNCGSYPSAESEDEGLQTKSCLQPRTDRMSAAYAEKPAPESGQSLLVVGHAGVNRVFLKLWLDLEPEDAIRIHFPHDAVYVLASRNAVTARSVTLGTIEGLLFHEK